MSAATPVPTAATDLYCVVGKQALLEGALLRDAKCFRLSASTKGRARAELHYAEIGLAGEVKLRAVDRTLPAPALTEAVLLFLRLAAKLRGVGVDYFTVQPEPGNEGSLELLLSTPGFSQGSGRCCEFDHRHARPAPRAKATSHDMEAVYCNPLAVPWNFVPVTTDLIHPLLAAMPAGARVLDLGCGYGKNLRYMTENGLRASGIEISARAVERAQEVAPGAAEIVAGSALELPWPDRSFDAVLDAGCTHCLPVEHRPTAAREVARVLADDGRLFSAILPPKDTAWIEALPFSSDSFGIDPKQAHGLLSSSFESVVATVHPHITNLVASKPRRDAA